jgi:hypothetical protein
MGDLVRMIRSVDQKDSIKQHKAKKKTREMLQHLERKGRMPPDFTPDGCA